MQTPGLIALNSSHDGAGATLDHGSVPCAQHGTSKGKEASTPSCMRRFLVLSLLDRLGLRGFRVLQRKAR